MSKVFEIIIFSVACIFFSLPCSALDIENTADNPRLVNLSPSQFRTLDVIEKRIYHSCYYEQDTIDRIERLEEDIFGEIQKGTISSRLAALRLESTKIAVRGTPMTPMMDRTFNSKYLNASSDIGYNDSVGLIDGLIRVWWPDFYAKVEEHRKIKEANFW